MTYPYTHTNYLRNSAYDARAHACAGELFSLEECRSAADAIAQWPDYKPTPLVDMTDIAEAAGVARISYKDESGRFGLSSFKALGGSYAIQQVAESAAKEAQELRAVATATDGNHGRSVAWGAQNLGIDCHIFLHANVSQSRADAMAAYGAQIHWVDGNYDDSIAACTRMATDQGWQIVSDTSWEGYREVPRQVMIGYTTMAAEIVEQLRGERPTHIVLQAGCGGLAGAMIAYFWQVWSDNVPHIIIVESDKSDCVYQSLNQSRVLLVDIVDETIMAGLSCGEVSQLAWPLLQKGAEHVVTINDLGVGPMMRRLAQAADGRPALEAGECSAAGLIALMAAEADPDLAAELSLDANSSVLVLGTEGATDPEIYQQIMAETD